MDYYKLGWRRWYWRLDDGRVFSGERGDYVPESDPDYVEFTSLVIGTREVVDADGTKRTVDIKRQATRMEFDGELALRLVHVDAPRELVAAAGLTEVGKEGEGMTAADVRAVLTRVGCRVRTKDGEYDATFPIDSTSEDRFAELSAAVGAGGTFVGYLRDADAKKVATQAERAPAVLSAILDYVGAVERAIDAWTAGGEFKPPENIVTIS